MMFCFTVSVCLEMRICTVPPLVPEENPHIYRLPLAKNGLELVMKQELENTSLPGNVLILSFLSSHRHLLLTHVDLHVLVSFAVSQSVQVKQLVDNVARSSHWSRIHA